MYYLVVGTGIVNFIINLSMIIVSFTDTLNIAQYLWLIIMILSAFYHALAFILLRNTATRNTVIGLGIIAIFVAYSILVFFLLPIKQIDDNQHNNYVLQFKKRC